MVDNQSNLCYTVSINNKEMRAIMKKMLNGFGITLIMLGIIAAAGAGGDCDGKCLENANTLPVFFLIIGGALTSMILGAIMMFQAGGISE